MRLLPLPSACCRPEEANIQTGSAENACNITMATFRVWGTDSHRATLYFALRLALALFLSSVATKMQHKMSGVGDIDAAFKRRKKKAPE